MLIDVTRYMTMNASRLFILRRCQSNLRSSATHSRIKPFSTRQIGSAHPLQLPHSIAPYRRSSLDQVPPLQQSAPRLMHDRNRNNSTSQIATMENMNTMASVDSMYEPKTGTWQYIVADPDTLHAVIIDPVLDFDSATQCISTTSADSLISLSTAKGYRVERILETHVHADHVTAASYLQSTLSRLQGFRPSVCIGKRIRGVQQLFGERYGVREDEMSSAFDCLLEDDEMFRIGNLQVKVMHLPGHTPDHIGYMIAG